MASGLAGRRQRHFRARGGACGLQSGASGPGRRDVRSLRRDGGPSAQQPAGAAAAPLGQGRPRPARRAQAQARVSRVGARQVGGAGGRREGGTSLRAGRLPLAREAAVQAEAGGALQAAQGPPQPACPAAARLAWGPRPFAEAAEEIGAPAGGVVTGPGLPGWKKRGQLVLQPPRPSRVRP